MVQKSGRNAVGTSHWVSAIAMVLMEALVLPRLIRASEVEVWPHGFFDASSGPRLSLRQLNRCGQLWGWAAEDKPLREQSANPFEVVRAHGADEKGESFGFRFDQQIAGAWVRVIPATYEETSIQWKPCRRCAVEALNCPIPTAWRALDSLVSVRFADDLRKVDQCLEGSPSFCLKRITAWGGLGFFVAPQSVPLESRAYGYLAWRLAAPDGAERGARERLIRSVFGLDPNQPIERQSTLDRFDSQSNHLVRQVRFSPAGLDSSSVPSWIAYADDARSEALIQAGRNEVFLPLSTVAPTSSRPRGSEDYYRDLLEGGVGGLPRIPGFALLEVGQSRADGEHPCANPGIARSMQTCRERLNTDLMAMTQQGLKTGRPMWVDAVLGGTDLQGDTPLYFKHRFEINPAGEVRAVSSAPLVVDPQEEVLGISAAR